jgi:uncharacterized protein YjlB
MRRSRSAVGMRAETYTFQDDGGIPNSPLPVLIYRDVDAATDASTCERRFADNGWEGAWRNGIYSFHHFHSTAHEVLGIVRGSASLTLGGSSGRTLQVSRGDVLVLPAGTGHYNAGSSDDLLVIGAYPDGMPWDLRRGDPAEHDEAVANIRAVPLPAADPVTGGGGDLGELWRAASSSSVERT